METALKDHRKKIIDHFNIPETKDSFQYLHLDRVSFYFNCKRKKKSEVVDMVLHIAEEKISFESI